MKNIKIVSITMLILAFAALACNFSTANLSSLKTSKDKEGKQESSSFKSGETIYANAAVGNNPGKVKVKLYLVADDVKGLTKGATVEKSDVTLDAEGDRTISYSMPVSPMTPPGSYTLNADMVNEAGEKKDSKSVKVTITGGGDAPKTEGDKPKTDEEKSEGSDDDSDQ